MKCSLVVCEARDPKGLYKRARTGEIDNYTGITSPYDVPLKPEITLPTSTEKVEESVNRVIDFLIDNRYINYSV